MSLTSSSLLGYQSTVQHTLIRGDGSRLPLPPSTKMLGATVRPISWWRGVWERVRLTVPFFSGLSFAAFLDLMCAHRPQYGLHLVRALAGVPLVGIVTSAGMTYLATTFTNNTNPLINFNFHTYGTGDVHGATSSPTNATAATPIVVTQSAHPFFLNDIIKITGTSGVTGVNGIWQISPVTANTYTLLGSVGGGSGFTGGTNAAQLLNGQADTAMTTEAGGLTRVAGTQSNPSSLKYRSVATVPFTGTTPPLTIVEWGLFSAVSSGTLWDRRWMNTANAPSTTASAALVSAPITITQTTDSIQTTNDLTLVAGGS